MPIETVLTIILSLLGGIGLHNFRGHFEQANNERSNVMLKAAVLLGELADILVREMDDDFQRSISHVPLPEDYIAQRRSNSARLLAKKIWDGAKRQLELENRYNSWSRWEEHGHNICAYGWIFYALFAVVIVYLAMGPNPIVMNNFNRSTIFLSIALPIICVGLCYIVVSLHKQKYIKLRDG